MSILTRFFDLSRTRNDVASEGAEAVQGDVDLADKAAQNVGTVVEFLDDVAVKLDGAGVLSLGDAIEAAIPWMENAAEVVGDALPPVM